LPINLFNEKFFILLWFWILFLAILTLINFLNWLKLLSPTYRKKLLGKYLKSHKRLGDGEKEREMFDSFVNDYFHLDGTFIMAIIRRNSNFLTTSEIVCALWSKYSREFSRSPHQHQPPKSILVSTAERGAHNQSAHKTNTVEIGMIDYDDELEEKTPFEP
jgi:hypothetical protein